MPHSVFTIKKNDLCCGCGFCSAGCPEGAISVQLNHNLEYEPQVDESKCSQCQRCLRICPFTYDSLRERVSNASRLNSEFGLSGEVRFFQGCGVAEGGYVASASGGVLSEVLKYILNENIVDAVIHAEPVTAAGEEPLFHAAVSRAAEDIDRRRGSFYFPIEFSQVISSIAEDSSVQRCCFVGLPCALTGLRQLCELSPTLRDKVTLKFGIVCSHNVSGQFAATLTESLEPRSQEYKRQLCFRDKKGIVDKNNFNNAVIFSDGREVRRSRFKTSFTMDWRSYSYALKSCFYCPDFWGSDSDASFKDAWGLPSRFRVQGESLVMVRNSSIEKHLLELKQTNRIELKEVDFSAAVASQGETAKFKSGYALQRLEGRVFSDSPPQDSRLLQLLYFVDYKIKKANAAFSKRLYRTMGLSTAFYRKPLHLALTLLQKFKYGVSVLFDEEGSANRPYSIVYAAGFGYGNVGDEAQLHANLELWKKLRPGCRVTILSPNPEYTRAIHGDYEVVQAPRKNLWSFGNIDYFGFGHSRLFPLLFWPKYGWVLCNALLYKFFGVTCFLSPRSSALFYHLKKADVLHIGGGGFLTGKTASRFYDNLALIQLARVFGAEVVLTGQTIGVWRNRVQRLFARQLRHARYIGLRDGSQSVEDLKTVDVYDEERVKVNCDDALFCSAATKQELREFLQNSGLSRTGPYLAVNVHYWILDRGEVNEAMDVLAQELDSFAREKGLDIVLVPMYSKDFEAITYLREKLAAPVAVFDDLDNFRLAIRIFMDADMCVTMKHHPIIFSMKGGVPTISISFEDYYLHKNQGALALFGQQGYALDHRALLGGEFGARLDEAWGLRKEIRKEILSHFNRYEKMEGEVLKHHLKLP